MKTYILVLWFSLLGTIVGACDGDAEPGYGNGSDGDSDADSDSDGDGDSDTDMDADTDSDTSTYGDAGLTWVLIEGGTFDMGSTYGPTDEFPVHEVAVPDFELNETEVTVAQFTTCLMAGVCVWADFGSTECNFEHSENANLPMNCVTWYQAVEFCEWVGGRLPSESEWEFAARSRGQSTMYPWGNEIATCDYAVMDEDGLNDGCGTGTAWDVCSKTTGETDQGLCDMAGNVREWVQDRYENSYDGAPTDGSALDGYGEYRVVRGGSYRFGAENLRAAIRSFDGTTSSSSDVGLRCAR